ncbi:hypothetical protein ACJJTC_017858 [Scirpophaga incertulas]
MCVRALRKGNRIKSTLRGIDWRSVWDRHPTLSLGTVIAAAPGQAAELRRAVRGSVEPVVRGEGPAAGCWPGPLRWLHSKPPRDARGERAAAETLEWHQYTYVTTSPNTTLDERRKWER